MEAEMLYQKQKERRERLKQEHRCVVCGRDLPENSDFFRCFKCRMRQTQADSKYREKKRIIEYFKSLVSDAENIGSRCVAGVDVHTLQKAISIMEGE